MNLQERIILMMNNYKKPNETELTKTQLRAFEILNKPAKKKPKVKLTKQDLARIKVNKVRKIILDYEKSKRK